MLIRKYSGYIFHIVQGETGDGRYAVCLCGQLIEKESLEVQTRAEWPYERCWRCRVLQNNRLKAHYNGWV